MQPRHPRRRVCDFIDMLRMDSIPHAPCAIWTALEFDGIDVGVTCTTALDVTVKEDTFAERGIVVFFAMVNDGLRWKGQCTRPRFLTVRNPIFVSAQYIIVAGC